MKKALLQTLVLMALAPCLSTAAFAMDITNFAEPGAIDGNIYVLSDGLITVEPAPGFYLTEEVMQYPSSTDGSWSEEERARYTYEFNTQGQISRSQAALTASDFPLGTEAITFEYDSNGNCTAKTREWDSARYHSAVYRYDSRGNCVKKISMFGTEEDYVEVRTYVYNDAGQLMQMTVQQGQSLVEAEAAPVIWTTTCTYDNKGCLKTACATTEYGTYYTVNYTFNSEGQLTEYTLLYGDPESPEASMRYLYDYNEAGNCVAVRVYEGGRNTETYRIQYTYAKAVPVISAMLFTDVETGSYYYSAVQWAVDQNITTGTSSTTFSPDESCTRAQAVTFLWRAAGSPEPENGNNPFGDVADGDYYYKAVLWAVEKGITNGTSETAFSPDITCNRAQIVTFLYRYEGSPKVSGDGFNDVPTGEYYYAPVIWAVSKGVTNGTGEGLFSPMDNCTRGQIVTFLYRDQMHK